MDKEIKKPPYFPFFRSHKEELELLELEEVGKLIMAVLQFTETGEEQQLNDRTLQIIYHNFVREIKTSWEHYSDICDKRREAGRLGGERKAENAKANPTQKNQKLANASKNYQMLANGKYAKTNVEMECFGESKNVYLYRAEYESFVKKYPSTYGKLIDEYGSTKGETKPTGGDFGDLMEYAEHASKS